MTVAVSLLDFRGHIEAPFEAVWRRPSGPLYSDAFEAIFRGAPRATSRRHLRPYRRRLFEAISRRLLEGHNEAPFLRVIFGGASGGRIRRRHSRPYRGAPRGHTEASFEDILKAPFQGHIRRRLSRSYRGAFRENNRLSHETAFFHEYVRANVVGLASSLSQQFSISASYTSTQTLASTSASMVSAQYTQTTHSENRIGPLDKGV